MEDIITCNGVHDNAGIKAPRGLIAHLTQRLRTIREELVGARLAGHNGRAKELDLHFRTVALLMASEPAGIMSDVAAKVLAVAMLRADGDEPGASSHALRMIERAITADMRALQGPPLV